jgi:hypothetical protein
LPGLPSVNDWNGAREERDEVNIVEVYLVSVYFNISTSLNIHERERRTKRRERIINLFLSVCQLVTSTLTFSHMLKKMSYGHFEMEDGSITKKKSLTITKKGC